MPVDRVRMRPWLEKMVDSEKIPGVAWIDKDRTMFTIPWKHAARHGWEMDKDAFLFKEWAIHTGKYSEGQACDPKTWKANFRCAMNSLPDIEEVKDRSVKKGQEARRVFKMLPVTKKARDRRSKARERKTRKKVKSEDDSDYSDSHSPANKAMLDEPSSSEEGSVDMEAPDYHSQSVQTISHTVEITTEHFSNFSYRFEVSPAHSNEESLCNINELWRPMENDTELTSGTHSQSYTSLDPTWSDSSSDIVDNTAQYTALVGSDLGLIQDNMLSCYLDS